MESLSIDYNFDLVDFKRMENIEHSYFIDDNITKAEEVMRWYQKNKLTCVGVRNSNNKVIASANILPLKKDIFYCIYNNKMNEADIVCEQIEKYKDNNSYYVYLSSISIDNKYRNNYNVIMTLLKGTISIFDILIERNINIKKVMADASTTHGEKICTKLLKMDYINETNHASKIFCEDGVIFIKAIDRIRKFVK